MKSLALTLCLLFLAISVALAASSTQLEGTVKVNICGNSLVETPAEDCEGSDLNGSSCLTLGYRGGPLACDISCSFDTTDCLAPTPTPSPSPDSAHLQTTNGTPPPAGPTPAPSPSPASTPPFPTPIIVQALRSLPTSVSNLIQEALSRPVSALTTSLVRPVIQMWVTAWQATSPTVAAVTTATPFSPTAAPADLALCDINRDAACDLYDFSVLLFYFQP